MTNLNILDQIAMKFEAHWSAEMAIADIPRFLTGETLCAEEKREILLELAMVDIDRRWQDYCLKIYHESKPDDLLHWKEMLPSAADYALLFFTYEQAIRRTTLEELREHEFVTRARLGDIPRPTGGLSSTVVEKIKNARPSIEVWKGGSIIFRQNVWGKLEIGRQASGEPNPCCVHETADSCKLICVPSGYDRISRRQSVISMLTPSHAVIKNTSSNRSFLIEQEAVSPPGTSYLASLPVSFQFDDWIFTLQPRGTKQSE